MKKNEAHHHFGEADRLFREGNYLEALQYLADLNRAFPNTFNIMFPMLLCREKLGRTPEAKEQCCLMLEQFPEQKYQERLQSVSDRLEGRRPHAAFAQQEVSPPRRHEFLDDPPEYTPINRSDTLFIGNLELPWRTIVIYAALIAVVLFLLISVPVAVGSIAEDVTGVYRALGVIVMLIAQFSLSCLVAYTIVAIMNKLNHQEIVKDILDVAVAMLIFSVLCLIPFVGWIIAYFKLAQHFEMSFSEVVVFMLLQAVFHIAFLYFILPLVVGDAAYQILELL